MKAFEKHFLDEIKKPVRKKDAFTVNVLRFFTDAAANVIDKNTLPANLKTSVPYFLWQKFDKDGGFKIGNSILGGFGPWKFLYCYEFGNTFDYFKFQGNNNLIRQFVNGDLIMMFGDDPVNFNYLAWVVIRCPFQAYTSILRYNNGGDLYLPNKQGFLQSAGLGGIDCYEFLLSVDQALQYNEALHLVSTNKIGQFVEEQSQPLSFKTPETILNDFITIKLGFQVNHMFGIY